MDHSVQTFPETRVWKVCFSSWKLRKLHVIIRTRVLFRRIHKEGSRGGVRSCARILRRNCLPRSYLGLRRWRLQPLQGDSCERSGDSPLNRAAHYLNKSNLAVGVYKCLVFWGNDAAGRGWKGQGAFPTAFRLGSLINVSGWREVRTCRYTVQRKLYFERRYFTK